MNNSPLKSILELKQKKPITILDENSLQRCVEDFQDLVFLNLFGYGITKIFLDNELFTNIETL